MNMIFPYDYYFNRLLSICLTTDYRRLITLADRPWALITQHLCKNTHWL